MFSVGPKCPSARCHSNSDRDLETIRLRPSHGLLGCRAHSAASHVYYGVVWTTRDRRRQSPCKVDDEPPVSGMVKRERTSRRLSRKASLDFLSRSLAPHHAELLRGSCCFCRTKSSDRLLGSRSTACQGSSVSIEWKLMWCGRESTVSAKMERGPRPGMWAGRTDVTSWLVFARE